MVKAGLWSSVGWDGVRDFKENWAEWAEAVRG